MIVYEAGRLHERVHDRRAYKIETAFFKIFAQCVGHFRFCGNAVKSFRFAMQSFAADKIPHVLIKRAEFAAERS